MSLLASHQSFPPVIAILYVFHLFPAHLEGGEDTELARSHGETLRVLELCEGLVRYLIGLGERHGHCEVCCDVREEQCVCVCVCVCVREKNEPVPNKTDVRVCVCVCLFVRRCR